MVLLPLALAGVPDLKVLSPELRLVGSCSRCPGGVPAVPPHAGEQIVPGGRSGTGTGSHRPGQAGGEPHSVEVSAAHGCVEAFGGVRWGAGEQQHGELDPHSRLLPGSLPWATHSHSDIYTGWERSIQPCTCPHPPEKPYRPNMNQTPRNEPE